jgi:predicted membrane protein
MSSRTQFVPLATNVNVTDSLLQRPPSSTIVNSRYETDGSTKHTMLHALEGLIVLMELGMIILALPQTYAAWTLSVMTWLTLTIVFAVITLSHVGLGLGFEHKLQRIVSSRNTPVNSLANAKLDHGIVSSTRSRITPSVLYAIIITAQISFVYAYAGTAAQRAALDNGFNTSGISTFVEDRYSDFLQTIVLGNALLLGYYFQSTAGWWWWCYQSKKAI